MNRDRISIHTIYIPIENIMHLKDWLEYHMFIGVDHFYLYDNSGSTKTDGASKGHIIFDNDKSVAKDGVNKYGHSFRDIPNIQKIQDSLLKKYPVTKVNWQPINENGEITYDYHGAILDLKQNHVDSGLVAFIDMDEYIVKREPFRPSRMLQQKYESRFHYPSVFDITNGLPFKLDSADTKCIVDMKEIDKNSLPYTMHFMEYDLPISLSWYNHYNYNKMQHDWIINNNSHDWVVTQGYADKIFGKYENVYETLPSLKQLSGYQK